jgi:NAD(P)-dependent dehydrogenase (short-subunit alcohol dehydrogenase family)
VNVSSGLSLTRDLVSQTSPSHFYPGIAYPASKAALNMITVQYAKARPWV